jgi:hypothetical protein
MAWISLFGVVIMGYLTFRRYSGLYFWSVVFATIGAFLYIFFRTLQYFDPLGKSYSMEILDVRTLVYIPAEFAMLYARYRLIPAYL